MKKLVRNLLMFLTLGFLSVSLAACTDTPETGEETGPATLTAEVAEVLDNSVKITVSTTSISEYAYVLTGSTEAAPIAVVIFKDGTTVTTADGDSTIEIKDLEYESNYTLHIAAKLAKKGFYKEVVSVDFTTGNYKEDVQIIRYNYDGADIHVRFPEAVKARGNKLKWMVSSIPDNKKWKPSPAGYWTDAELVQQNEQSYPAFLIHRDTTLRIREENRVFADKSNEYYPRITPGEPLIVSIQEVLPTTDDSNHGWGAGWYGTPFLWEQFMTDYSASLKPNEEDYWPENSWHKTLRFQAKDPEKLNGEVVIGLLGYDGSTNLSPKGGKVTLTPNGDTFCYCVSILDHALYQTMILNWIGGKRDRMQWFTTSAFAAYEGLAASLYASAGPTSIDIAEWFAGNITPGGHYHVLVTAMGGVEDSTGITEDPTRQTFTEFEFTVPNYTLPAPTMKVTPLESNNPFEVKFNVKCTSTDTAPIEKASFACNYVRDFSIARNSDGFTYAELVNMNVMQNVYFTDAEVVKMNTPEGCDITFYSREDAASGLVVMGWNYEGRPSNPDAEGSEAYAEARTPQLPDAERVESPLFTDLLGDWTATTTLYATKTHYVQDENGKYVEDENGYPITEKENIVQEVKSKVTIGDLYYPESLTQDVYDLYAKYGFTKEQTDAMFEEGKALAANFNRKVRGQNRLLCQGLDFDLLEGDGYYAGLLDYRSAWDLFVSTDYSSSAVEDNFYDFGPKWHLQIDSEGNVFVPVNVNRILPLTNWRGAEVLFFGYNPDTNEALMAPQNDSGDTSTWPNLPVEVSEDKNTITIKPFVYNYTDAEGNAAQRIYYPNMIINSNTIYGMFPMTGKIKGDIVLTRGWTETGSDAGTTTVTAQVGANDTRSILPASGIAPIRSANGAQYVKKSVKSRTNFKLGATRVKPTGNITYTEVKVKPINREKFLK
ncbi:MAG: hypothetical protein E7130_01525 [Rikenellaceae bacterium]|nr:hypothetical protein [Rikenellaceae bacterium]